PSGKDSVPSSGARRGRDSATILFALDHWEVRPRPPGVSVMAVNLTPQYHEAEQEYKKAQTAEDRLAALQKMWKEVPKHKASEKLQAELKQKISATKEEVEQEKKTGKKTGVSYKIPRQGAGQFVFLGS